MKSVTINISPQDHYVSSKLDLPTKGTLIKITKQKRVYMVVTNISNDEPYTHTLTGKFGYKPSPKSQLRKKSPFSQFKMRILN